MPHMPCDAASLNNAPSDTVLQTETCCGHKETILKVYAVYAFVDTTNERIKWYPVLRKISIFSKNDDLDR